MMNEAINKMNDKYQDEKIREIRLEDNNLVIEVGDGRIKAGIKKVENSDDNFTLKRKYKLFVDAK